jgi:predicted nucleotidyltransferase
MAVSHKKIIEQVVEEYKGKEYVLGIMLFGSHALGFERAGSDIDIYIFVREEKRSGKKKYMLHGTEIGLTFLTIPTAARKMVYAQSKALLRNLMEGKVLYSIDSRLPFLQELAKRIKRRPYRQEWMILKRKRLTHFLESTKRLAEEGKDILALYSMNFAFNEAIRLFYYFRQWRPAKRTYILKELKEGDRKLYDLTKDYLSEENVKRKHDFLSQIITHVIAPHGGFLPKTWRVPLQYSFLTRPFYTPMMPSLDLLQEEFTQVLDEYGQNMVPIIPEAEAIL